MTITQLTCYILQTLTIIKYCCCYIPSSIIIISIGQIKQIDVTSKKCSTLAGLGKPCLKDGEFSEAGFSEPGGLCLSGDKLYIADTNNHCVRVMDLHSNIVSLVSSEYQSLSLSQ